MDRACMPAKLLQSCPTLCDPMDCSPGELKEEGVFDSVGESGRVSCRR